MSNRKRPRDHRYDRLAPDHRGHATPGNRAPGPGETYLIIPAVANDRHVPGIEDHLRQITHDALYEQAADGQLTTGVWWTTHYGAEALDRYQRALEACGQKPETQEQADQYGVQLADNPQLLLVIAWAIGRRTP